MTEDKEIGSDSLPPVTEGQILSIGTIVELILAGISLAIIWFSNLNVRWTIGLENTVLGVWGAILLFLANRLLYWLAGRSDSPWAKETKRFRDTVVLPLAGALSLSNVLALSLLAGLCEELFFRGALQTLLGTFFAALTFVALHFGPGIRNWRIVPVIYFLVSLFFSGIYSFSYSLWAVVVAHALYDAIVLIDLQRKV